MFIKQPGSYERLLSIARMTYPDAKPIKTETFLMEDNPILVLTFETEGFENATEKGKVSKSN